MKEVADCVNCPTPSLEVHRLLHSCRIGSNFVGYLGLPFKFSQMEFLSKKYAKKSYSGSRSLICVKRSIMMLRVVFERMLSSGENSFEGVVSKSYEQSFAAYHGWATRTAVFASLPHLPTRSKLMKKLKENEAPMTV
ncbi:Accelerated cell death 11 [Vitis vinifera]|uniref:Accelerated cell death 11 n=1 Tax=Vitis vinifera TaxID=29760 RepID=A0A438GUN2_VITVI|nr:Accelerated cell death 11 [Vitis vinifera]